MVTGDEVRSRLAESRRQLLEAISGVSEEQFKRRPADGSWCIAEVLAFQLASEQFQAGCVRQALQEDAATIAAPDPEALESRVRLGRTAPVPQLIHGLLAARRELDVLLDEALATPNGLQRSVKDDSGTARTIEHLLLNDVAGHEQELVSRIEALKSSDS